MKIVTCDNYGPPNVLKIREAKKPIPHKDEVLIKIHAVNIGIEDPMHRSGKPFLLVKPIIGFVRPRKSVLGTEFSGVIESIGKDVKDFKVGDKVFGSSGSKLGCYAEYLTLPENAFISNMPENICFEEAAPVCGALAAWDFLVVKALIKPGQEVLINGASSSIGSAATQIAKVFNAKVTIAHRNKDTNFPTQQGQIYDIILDVNGKEHLPNYKDLLKPKGIYLTALPNLKIIFQMLWTKIFGGKRIVFSATGLQSANLRKELHKGVIELINEGGLKVRVDKVFSLEQIVDAHKRVEDNGGGEIIVVSIK